jgi:hypothetical protein
VGFSRLQKNRNEKELPTKEHFSFTAKIKAAENVIKFILKLSPIMEQNYLKNFRDNIGF